MVDNPRAWGQGICARTLDDSRRGQGLVGPASCLHKLDMAMRTVAFVSGLDIVGGAHSLDRTIVDAIQGRGFARGPPLAHRQHPAIARDRAFS